MRVVNGSLVVCLSEYLPLGSLYRDATQEIFRLGLYLFTSKRWIVM